MRRPRAPPPTTLLAIDPGPKYSGWARLDISGPRPRFIDGGNIKSEDGMFRTLIASAQRLAVEAVGLAFRVEARHALIQTAAIEGRIVGLALDLLDVTSIQEIQAVDWRRELTGNRSAKNRIIKLVVRGNLLGLPGKFNCHVADACGLGLVAALRIRTRRAA